MLCGLLVADLVIGLTYLSVIRGLAGNYTLPQRVYSVVANMAGFSGPVQFIDRDRGRPLRLRDRRAWRVHLARRAARCSCARPSAGSRLRPADASGSGSCSSGYGEQDSLGYFTLRNDKSIIWSPTGKACIGYRVLSGVMLASGDPIGDPEAWPGAIHTFLDEAARHAWVPAVIGCSELGAEIWCREGDLTALELGDEAVVSVADFTLEGRAMRNVRQMVSRVCRQGYTAEIRRVEDIPADEISPDGAPGRQLAGQPDRARLLDGPRAASAGATTAAA